jgi:PKD repeat protein
VARFSYNTEFYCDSTIVHFINQSTDGDVFQWYVNGHLFSSSENPSYTFTQPGFYDITLFIQDTISLLDSNITHQIEIKGKTYSTISASACNEYLSPSGNYLWNYSGTYLDTISNSLGCDSIITVNLTILHSSSTLISPVVCDSFVSPSGQYVWYASGAYLDILPNSVGCDSNIIVQLTVVEVDTSIQFNQQQLWANASNATYQWCMCDNSILLPIANATNQSYTPMQSGYYAVIVTQQGCSDTSNCHYFNYTHAGNSYRTEIKVYPNPLKDHKINIVLPEQTDMLNIQLFELSGKPVLQKSFFNSQKVSLELHLPAGIYFMQIQTDKENSIFKIIKS